jgi:hypothetical protein
MEPGWLALYAHRKLRTPEKYFRRELLGCLHDSFVVWDAVH